MSEKAKQQPWRPRIPQFFGRHNYDPPPSVRPPPPPPPPPPAKWFAPNGNSELGESFPVLLSPYEKAISEALRVPDEIERRGRLSGLALLAHEHVYRGALCAIAVVQAKAGDRENAEGNLNRARHAALKHAETSGIFGVRALCGVAVAVKNAGFNPNSDFQAADQKARAIKSPIQTATIADAKQAEAEVLAYQGNIEEARKTAEKIWRSNNKDDAMLSRKDLAIAFAEAGIFRAALQEADEIDDIRHRRGVWDTIAAGQAEDGQIAEAEKTVGNISDKWISALNSRFVQGQNDVRCNDVIGAWSDRLESALKTAWALEKWAGDPNAFRRFINGGGGIHSPLCRAKAWMAFAKRLMQDSTI